MQPKGSRIAKWDNLKFILILSVVLGHVFARYDDVESVRKVIFLIYSFHMPAFVFISGLFSTKTIDSKRYDKIFSFLILFVVTKLAHFLSGFIWDGKGKLSFVSINDVSWYALAIFVFYLLTIFLKQFDWKYVLGLAIVLSCFAGYADDIGTFLSASRILTFYPFFLAGYYLSPQKVLDFTNRKVVKAFSALFLVGIIALIMTKIDSIYWLLKILKGKTGYATLIRLNSWGGIWRLGWYLYAGLFIIALIAVTPSFHSFLTTVGSRTMQIYALHYMLMSVFFQGMKGSAWAQRVSPGHYLWLILAAGIFITVILAAKPITTVMNAIIYPQKRDTREKD